MRDVPYANLDPYAIINAQLEGRRSTPDVRFSLRQALILVPQLEIPPAIRNRTLPRALLVAAKIYKARYGEKPPHYASPYWNIVFEQYFGSPPRGDDDPRWDTLLLTTPTREGALTRAEKLRVRFPKSDLF